MTRQNHRNELDDIVELVAEHGTDAIASAFTTLLDLAMKIERQQVLGAAAYERTEQRRG